LKHWVLFGAQGDPMIEADRPTIATLLKDNGYRTAMVGKWHVGLRYRQSDGRPAAGWQDADLTQPLYDTPLDHGFDYCRFTSRSHGTSGATPSNRKKKNDAQQSVGPGHIHGRMAVGASGDGKRLVEQGADAYVLNKLGSRHSDHAIGFLDQHLTGAKHASQPFFLYYPSNSNHGPHTPDTSIGGVPVAGQSKNVAGQAMNVRSDYIYENDVALGRLIDYLQANDDPRRPGSKLIDNTIVIFTSDNGAEIKAKSATGPFRSHKGSSYEGGHRVPFLVAWKRADVGDGDSSTAGETNPSLIGLQDMFATFAEILGQPLPDLRAGQKGAEDSRSVLAAWQGETLAGRVMFFHDHSEAADHAAAAFRVDQLRLPEDRAASGQWKMFFDASLLRAGQVRPMELFDLKTDSREQNDRLQEAGLRELIGQLSQQAHRHRTAGGHRMVDFASPQRVVINWAQGAEPETHEASFVDLSDVFDGASVHGMPRQIGDETNPLAMTVHASHADRSTASYRFHVNPRGLGVSGGKVGQIDSGEAIHIQFDRDVIVESAAIVAGNGTCGGYYRVGTHAPLAIYCVDADIDAQDQSGILSDIGVLKSGMALRLDSSPHHGVESPGQWRLHSLTVRLMLNEP
jgi:arylsulfatase A